MGILSDLVKAGKGYNVNSMVLLGDSRLAGFSYDPTARLRRSAANFLAMAFRLTGQRMRVEKSYAVSGLRSDQYLSAQNVADALARSSYWLVLYGVANDIGQRADGADYFAVYIKPVADAWTATGRRIILITETGGNSFTTAAQRGAVYRYNRQVRDYCRENRSAVLFDAAAIVMDPTQPMTINPAYSGDGLHIGLMNGAYALGSKFAALINQIAPPCDGLVYSSGQVFANGGTQLFSNPLWLTTTGGFGSGIMSGTIPAGITDVTAAAGWSVVGSVSAGAYGNDLQLAITAGAAGAVTFTGLIATELEIVGERYYANCEWDLLPGSVNFQFAGPRIDVNRDGVTLVTQDGITDTTAGALAAGTYTFSSETERLVIPSGPRGFMSVRFAAYFSAAGSATLKLRRLGLWRHLA